MPNNVYEFHYKCLSMASAQTSYIYIKTNGKQPTIELEIKGFGGFLEITGSRNNNIQFSVGSIINTYNQDHNNSDNASTKIYYAPTIIGTPDVFANKFILASSTTSDNVKLSLSDKQKWKDESDYIVSVFSYSPGTSFTIDGIIEEN